MISEEVPASGHYAAANSAQNSAWNDQVKNTSAKTTEELATQGWTLFGQCVTQLNDTATALDKSNDSRRQWQRYGQSVIDFNQRVKGASQ